MMMQSMSSGILDQVLQEFLQAFQGDFSRIENLAKDLFYYLAGIQIVMSAIWLMFKGDPIDAVVKTIQVFFTMSVFYTLVLFGGSWMPQILDGFISAGSTASGIYSLTPSALMDQGISIGFAIMDNFSNWGWVTHPFGSLLAVVILISIVVLYAFMAGEMAILLVKSYALVALSGLMFAFGANETVRPISMNYFKAVIGLGLQLMTFYLIMGVGVKVGSDWQALITQAAQLHDLKPFLVVMAAVIIFYLIVKNIPPFIGGLAGVGGFRSYGDAAVGAALTAGGVTAQGAMSAAKMGGVAAGAAGQFGKGVFQAGHSAAQEMKNSSGLGKAFGFAAKNVGSSVASSIKDTVMKTNQNMSFGQKVNSKMSENLAQNAVSNSKSSTPDSSFKPNKVKK